MRKPIDWPRTTKVLVGLLKLVSLAFFATVVVALLLVLTGVIAGSLFFRIVQGGMAIVMLVVVGVFVGVVALANQHLPEIRKAMRERRAPRAGQKTEDEQKE